METNLHYKESYKVVRTKDIRSTLHYLNRAGLYGDLFQRRGFESLVDEWKAHNILYWLGIKRSSTKDVDLNTNETKGRISWYKIVAWFYPVFELFKK